MEVERAETLFSRFRGEAAYSARGYNIGHSVAGRRVVTKLIRTSTDWAKKWGVQELRIHAAVGIDQERVGRFYKRLGFLSCRREACSAFVRLTLTPCCSWRLPLMNKTPDPLNVFLDWIKSKVHKNVYYAILALVLAATFVYLYFFFSTYSIIEVNA